MCSGHIQGRLLKMLVQLTGARTVVELGAFSGYATICLAEGLPADGRLISIEHDDEKERIIRQGLARCGIQSPETPEHERRVELWFGDALQMMASMPSGSVDLLFIDADKREYPGYYLESRRLVRPGGLIVADNTLWDGHVVDPAYDSDPQTRAIKAFNDMVAADRGVEQVMLPLRDGLTLIRVNTALRQ